jgi:FtsZ-interacting cell division protein ZipA
VWWKQWTWPLKIATVIGVIIVIGLIVGGLRSCGKKKDIKIDHEAIQKVNSLNRAEVKKEVRELVEENADVIEATNDQTTLTEVNAVERDRVFEEKVREVDQKIQEAKAQDGDVSQEDLQCILVPSDCGRQ